MPFTESQNDLIWKGSLKVTSSKPLLKVGSTSGQVGSTSRERDSSVPGQLVPLLDHPYSKKPFLSCISILVSVASSIEACSSRVAYPCYVFTLSSTGCIWALYFFSSTLHGFYPTQTETQSQHLAGGRVAPGSWEWAQTCILLTAWSECQTLEMARDFIPHTALLLLLLLENTARMLVSHQSNVLHRLVGPFHRKKN